MTQIHFAQQDFILNPKGALYWPSHNTLIISDLHLEKGSYFANRGSLLPPYDTLETLSLLKDLLLTYNPAEVICLGDNIHDKNALQRMQADQYQLLYSLCKTVKSWKWIIGNHDKDIMQQALFADFDCVNELTMPTFSLRHEPSALGSAQMVGHFHPKISLQKGNLRINGKCFIFSESLFILPSFGTFTGGLDIGSEAIQKLFHKQTYHCYLAHKDKVWPV